MTGMARRYRRWFEYEKDSDAKVLAALRSAPARARKTDEFRKAVDLAAHIIAARRIWLFRLGGAEEVPSDFFPTGLTLSELKRRFEGMHRSWTGFLSRIDDRKVARSFAYTSSEGIDFRNTVEDVLTQLYGHSLYHRGQIGALLRAAGAEPPQTDFVFWARKPARRTKR